MGVARLSKVTVISPRAEYSDVAKALAKFKDFHPLHQTSPNFDPRVQELTVRAVRLFSQADQATKDLGLKAEPGWMDQVFGGVKVETTKFDAEHWDGLLTMAETELEPVAQEVKTLKASLQKTTKDMTDAQTLMEALKAVSGLSADIAGLGSLRRFRAVVCIAGKTAAQELRNSLPDALFESQPVGQDMVVLLVAVKSEEGTKLDRAVKALEIRTLTIPEAFPQNPAEAYREISKGYDEASKQKSELEGALQKVSERSGAKLLAVRDLSEVARDMLDEARVSGDLKRMATISGYIPAKKEKSFMDQFGRWMVYAEPAHHTEEGEGTPVLFENPTGVKLWQLVTREQGIPGNHEVDPTPLISFVFPIFFGLMFGDFGHGLIFTLFVLFVRQRTSGTKRQWANIFLITGISSMVFGAIFGEFFGYSLYTALPVPPIAKFLNLEIVNRTGASPTPDIGVFVNMMEISMLIGIFHLATGLGLDVYQGLRAGEKLDVLIEKLPAFAMYISGVGYGVSFIAAGFKFNVLASSTPIPYLGIPTDQLGSISLAVLVPSMLVLFLGKPIAVKAGKLKGISFAGALSEGGLEVFERILQFLSNTVSYVRLAVMLLVHAVLLLIIAGFFPLSNPVLIPFWVVFNLMVLALEGLIVYVQDLRLHVYEFFTKFYAGTGQPFRRILPDRQRISINWA